MFPKFMKKICLISGLLLTHLLLLRPDFAAESLNIDSLAMLGVDLVHHEKFDTAFVEFHKIIKAKPEEPIGYFFVAAAYQTIIDDYRSDKYKENFNHYVDLAIEKGKKKLEKKDVSALDYFYTGAAIGYRGIFRAFHGDWWGAFWDGGKAKGMMEEALKRDSALYDAYYGLGTYYYWRSVKSKILWWLPFFGDNRQKGIDYTKLAIQKGRLAVVEGKYALIRIYAEEKDWRQVLAWYDSVKVVNQDDPYCLWLVGLAHIQLQQYDSARQVFANLLKVQKTSDYFDLASEMEIRYWLALIDYYQEDFRSALSEIGFVFANKYVAEENEYAKNAVEWAKDLKEKIDQKMGIK